MFRRNDSSSGSGSEKEKNHRISGRKRRWRILGLCILILAVGIAGARLAMPYALRWYVVRVINRNPLYRGQIDDIDVHLWRGAYTIRRIRLTKTTANIPVPLLSAQRVDLAIEWKTLLAGKVVGKMTFDQPQLNFVDAPDPADAQSGANGSWLQVIKDLFPFRINSAEVHEGAIHFRSFTTDPPVDVYLSYVDGSIQNLTNIHGETAPLIATVQATALAMDQAKLQYQMKLDPFSYRPSFELRTRLLGLDVTKLNALAQAYGGFDFQRGQFDLVLEMISNEGTVDGYVKPLFRDIEIFNLAHDARKDNPLQLVWEAVVGVTTTVLQNPPRRQFATQIPLHGDLDNPNTDLLATIGNVLRNAFIRAYLPRFEATDSDLNPLTFDTGSVVDPSTDFTGGQ